MTDPIALLREYADSIDVMAGSDETASPSVRRVQRLDVKRFHADLDRIRRSQAVWFSVCIIATLVVAAGALLLALAGGGKPAGPVPAGVGGVGGCMAALTFAGRLVRRRAQTDLLIALAATMDEPTLQTIVAAVVRSLG